MLEFARIYTEKTSKYGRKMRAKIMKELHLELGQ
jgi:hypothetical protein